MKYRKSMATALGALMLGAPLAAVLATTPAHAEDLSHRGVEPFSSQTNMGKFSVQGNQTATVADLKNPELYKICVEHNSRKNAEVIYDGRTVDLNAGNCLDVEAANIQVKAPQQMASNNTQIASNTAPVTGMASTATVNGTNVSNDNPGLNNHSALVGNWFMYERGKPH